MVVTPSVSIDRAAAEERLKQLERRNALLALRDDEFGPNLPAQLHHGASVDVHAEAAFAVDEPSDPAFQPEPFLLIICTRHVVTILAAEADGISSAGYSDVPAYGQLHPSHRCDGGQRLSCHLRTVIVTAAVYRGLVSELRRPKTANPST